MCGRWVPKQLADAAILGCVKKFKKDIFRELDI